MLHLFYFMGRYEMIEVGIRLESEVIIRDELLSKFKSFKISTIIGYTDAVTLDNCRDIIYKESIVGDKYPNTFKIIGVDNTNTNILQVIVNPSKHDYTYTISLKDVNEILAEESTNYSLDKIDEVVVDKLMQHLYFSH